jgi:predicted phosphate transport protein (TIGR00153 family)
MFKKFLPRRDIFFAFFEKHISISYEAAEQLLHFVTANQKPQEIFQKIKKLENDADSITHQCVEVLHKTFITPMDRSDIYRLITTLDNITDEIEGIAKRLFLYKLELLRPEAAQLAEIVVHSVREVAAAVKELRKMKITATLQKHFYNINHLENEADALLNQALMRLFDEETDTKALIKWKEVYEHLENATDVCEDVSNILEGIILENE